MAASVVVVVVRAFPAVEVDETSSTSKASPSRTSKGFWPAQADDHSSKLMFPKASARPSSVSQAASAKGKEHSAPLAMQGGFNEATTAFRDSVDTILIATSWSVFEKVVAGDRLGNRIIVQEDLPAAGFGARTNHHTREPIQLGGAKAVQAGVLDH
eukprot:CAMPEP_0177342554 /NCGR_PEP_ID=MMETSP0368-20130122/27107_1 /TAXON_ID=447022 ORGANISM="Scrippsiella hangoei-like, Strain SHHI-4" /NCGR_SAMPLE_ID=MMETSP0368 /ASSEMBLY_ACC=CAM_ASM_000363 /LENGTH=155 /DNA_ID=CAMNT_0018803933 /DNA_START=106 /DNA_END=569 /DNA_ORIENTATION=+